MKRIDCESCPIRHPSCIADIDGSDLRKFEAFSVSAVYKPRQVVFHEGTPAAGLYVLCSGAVKLYQSGRLGREHILAVTAPGDVLGELPLGSEACYSESAEVLVESQLCYLPRANLLEFIETHPMVGVRLIAALSDALVAARKKVRDMVLKPADTRMAELLVGFVAAAPDQGAAGTASLRLAYSRRDIAEMIGVSTETAIRLLGKLKDQGVIEAHGRDILITDLARLRRMARQGL